MQDAYFAEESKHRDVFGDASDEDIAATVLLVEGIGLVVEVQKMQEGVEVGRHGQWSEDDKEAGGYSLKDYELRGGAEASV